jgi:hypothetical protein
MLTDVIRTLLASVKQKIDVDLLVNINTTKATKSDQVPALLIETCEVSLGPSHNDTHPFQASYHPQKRHQKRCDKLPTYLLPTMSKILESVFNRVL